MDTVRPSNAPRTRKYVYWMLAACFLATLLFLGKWVFSPSLNPAPKKAVTVSGEFPYSLGWDLRIQQEFHSTTPLCEIAERVFLVVPVAEVPRVHRMWIPVAREGEGRYRFVYYEDQLLPGVCQWELRFTSFRIFKEAEYLQGGAILGLNKQSNRINYTCRFVDLPTPGSTRGASERGVACYEGNNRSYDSQYAGNEVNFNWKEATER
jgi:hypothetical protein